MTIGLATSKFGKMAAISLLKVHSEGQGKNGFKRPVLFPKIVFFYMIKIFTEMDQTNFQAQMYLMLVLTVAVRQCIQIGYH